MAEFYQETILVKVEVVDGENIFGGLRVCQLFIFHMEFLFPTLIFINF